MRYRPERLERLFIVRVWREEGSSPLAFRGSVHDVEAGLRLGFSAIGELEDLLLRRLRLGESGAVTESP
jgi:hypothetical protein